MNKIFNWLSAHKGVSYPLATFYYLLIVLPHEQVGAFVVGLFKNKTRAYYQHTVLLGGVILLALLLFVLIRSIKNHPFRGRLIVGLIATLAFMIAAFNLLIIHNIEIVHFLQYFSLCFFIYPLVKNLDRTFFWSTLAGVFDEANQYLILAPQETNYFDFNDIILNEIGAGMGVVLLFALGFYTFQHYKPKWYKSPEILVSLVIAITLVVMALAGEFTYSLPQQGEQPLFVLIKKVEPGFFTVIKHLNASFHVVRPYEGIVIIPLLGIFYSRLLNPVDRKKNE
jgi:hypothetical protein